MRYGDLVETPEGWQLRFTRTLRHPVPKVWRALTEPEHLAPWFPSTIDGEWRAGAPLRFEFPGHDLPGIDGEVLRCDPPSMLEYRWGGDVLRFELQPDGDGTILTLYDTIDELGKGARDGAGWHECLARLERSLDGDERPIDSAETWPEVAPEYERRFGPEASTIGPPEGVTMPATR